MAGFIASRPVAAEIEAIASAIAIAGEAGCALHIVHVSSGSAAALVAEAKAAGADVTCETCPHYLALTDEDAERIGLLAKCAPPLRTPAERDGLWRALRLGTIDLVASDHSPAPPELKQGNALEAWGGISGCQTTARVLLAEGLAPSELARLCAAAPAERFGLPGGRVEPGAPAEPAPARSVARGEPRCGRAALPPSAEPVHGSHPARARRAHDAARPHRRDRRPAGRRAARAVRCADRDL